MSGYSAKVRSIGFTAGGKWLATSGSEQLILWPFARKDGPMGKQPRMVLPHDKRVVVVACHPRQEIVAAGFEDGMVMLARIEDGAEILAKKPGSGAVSALAWSPEAASSRSEPKTARPASSISPDLAAEALRADRLAVRTLRSRWRRPRRIHRVVGQPVPVLAAAEHASPDSRAPRASCRRD